MSVARLEWECLSTATCEHLAYPNRTVPRSSAASTTCATCECLADLVQTEFPSHHLMTLLLLPVNTELLKVSLGEKERQLSHHTPYLRLCVCVYCCELHVAMGIVYMHAVCNTSTSVWYIMKYDWIHECMYIRILISVCVCVL